MAAGELTDTQNDYCNPVAHAPRVKNLAKVSRYTVLSNLPGTQMHKTIKCWSCAQIPPSRRGKGAQPLSQETGIVAALAQSNVSLSAGMEQCHCLVYKFESTASVHSALLTNQICFRTVVLAHTHRARETVDLVPHTVVATNYSNVSCLATAVLHNAHTGY